MENWQSKEIGTGLSSLASSNAILQTFGPAFLAAGKPRDMAVFLRHDIRNDIVTAYFSPTAASLAAGFGVSDCAKPEPCDRLVLLVGDTSSWDIHFPECCVQRDEL